MLWLALVGVLHAQDLDVPDLDWEKPEGELPSAEEEPVISCCGFDRGRWREMIQEVLPEVRECMPTDLDEPLRVSTTLTIEAGGTEVRAEVKASDEAFATCLKEALDLAVWPGEPAPCTFRVSYPFVFSGD